MSSATTTDIIKVVAPIALQALVTAANGLIDGDRQIRPLVNDPVGSQLFTTMSEAGSNLWGNNFGYFYQGNTSRCVLPDGKTVKALNSGSDLIIYDQTQGQMPNVEGFLKALFQATALQDSSAILLSNNLTTILTDQWTEESLDWAPLTKTYAQLTDDQGNTVNVDMLLYTACAEDVNNNLAGLAYFMFTFYPDKAPDLVKTPTIIDRG